MKITIFGTWYAGLVTGACLAQVWHDVLCIDIDSDKIKSLQSGVIPIYEPGLEEIVVRNTAAGRLTFSTDPKQWIQHWEAIFNAVGTPPDKENANKADLKFVRAVAKTFWEYISEYKVFINKSTVPVGTGKMCHEIIKREIFGRNKTTEFDVASNPEFLREWSAVSDFLYPDRVVLGSETSRAQRVLQEIYKPFERTNTVLFFTNIQSAELIKYAANSFLATKISFINEIANFAEHVGADITDVARWIGLDPRIGNTFLSAGAGYGWSCFPKDVKALVESWKELGYNFEIIAGADSVNTAQKQIVVQKLLSHLWDISGMDIAVWGLAFKPNTDDVREAVSEVVIDGLHENKAWKIKAFDPIANTAFVRNYNWNASIEYYDNYYETLENADAMLLLTEWDEFFAPDWKRIKKTMKWNTIIDARNIWDRDIVESYGFTYIAIWR